MVLGEGQDVTEPTSLTALTPCVRRRHRSLAGRSTMRMIEPISADISVPSRAEPPGALVTIDPPLQSLPSPGKSFS